MSPTLLSKRLQQLVRVGLVTRIDSGRDVEYVLTPAGRELEPVVGAIGAWGVRWIGELGWPQALRTGLVTLQGPATLRRAIPVWFPPSRFAAIPRAEDRLSEVAPR